MSTLKVDTIRNYDSAVDFSQGLNIGGTSIIQNYTESADMPSSPSNGDYWWDTGNNKLYKYMDSGFKELGIAPPPSNPWSGDRGMIAGGETSTASISNVVQYFDITTAGNTQDFGDLTTTTENAAGASSSARGLSLGGSGTSGLAEIQYVTISTLGNAQDFGDLATGVYYHAACSDGTKAFVNGGYNGSFLNQIQYVTIATTGNAADWGDLVGTSWLGMAATADTTRVVHYVGHRSGYTNAIDYYSTASAGNASDFGNATAATGQAGACSDATRAVIGGGTPDGGTTIYNKIDYLTIQTTGNAADFGDLTAARFRPDACANYTRGVFSGGNAASSTKQNVMDFVTIQTTGNATDFGDLLEATVNHCSFSGSPS
tara:strand:+ start:2939 stop:4057 length:1119 start_codon:yes stop_codon:yes gene_type:complete